MTCMRAWWSCVVVILGLGALSCAGCLTPGASDCDCTADQECVDGECRPAGGASSSSGGFGTYCDSDAECGADEYCIVEVHLCVSRHDCDTVDDCMAGQECRDFDGDGYRDCGYPGCDSDAQCKTELSCTGGQRARCVARACVCQNPCEPACDMQLCCGTTAGCASVNGSDACCIADPGPCAGMTCDPGYEPRPDVVGTWSVDACAYLNTSGCMCVEKAPLPEGIIGDPHAIGLDGQGVLHIAAYAYGPWQSATPDEPLYGDLVVGTSPAGGGAITWKWVDGVPAGAPVVGGPSGPRAGVEAPGPNVGTYLDMAVATDGTVHVAYQNASDLTLRYARVTPAGAVTSFTLDPNRETGVYPAIALSSTGIPRVAWLQRRDSTGSTPTARFKIASATSATPTQAQDFTTYVARELDLTTVACEGGCATGYRCRALDAPAIPDCVLEAPSTCASSCGIGRFCSAGQCFDEQPGSNTRQVPTGPGVFATMLTLPNNHPLVAAYDPILGGVRLFTSQGGPLPESTTATIAESTLVWPNENLGSWPSLALGAGGDILVAFSNETTKAIEMVTLGANLNRLGWRVVDNGERSDGISSELHRLVEPAVILRSDGVPVIAYQDATTGELMMAVGGTSFTTSKLAGASTPFDGYYGFSTDIAGRGAGAPVISTFKKNPDPEPSDDRIVLFNWP